MFNVGKIITHNVYILVIARLTTLKSLSFYFNKYLRNKYTLKIVLKLLHETIC